MLGSFASRIADRAAEEQGGANPIKWALPPRYTVFQIDRSMIE
jgi:hypothetical protein